MVSKTNNSSVSSVISREPSPLAVVRSLGPLPGVERRSRRRRNVSVNAATGYVGAAMLFSAALIEVVRAWLAAPGVVSDAGEVLGGSVVALFVIGALGSLTRVKELGGVAIASSFALLAYGAILVLQGQSIGILFVGLAPLSGVLTHTAFRENAAQTIVVSGTIELAWAIAKCRAKNARAAARAASPSPLAIAA